MRKTTPTPRSFWLTIIIFTIIVNLTMMRSTYLRLLEIQADLLRSTWSGMLILCLVIIMVCIWMIFRDEKKASIFFKIIDRNYFENNAWRIVNALIFIAILILIPYIKFRFEIGQDIKKPVYDPSLLLLLYYWMCWWVMLIAATTLKEVFQTSWMVGFVSAFVLFGVTYEVLIRFNVVTSYPFSLGWSEGSRYYYASLLFSNRLYGEAIPLSPYHASRYILQSIPFLFSELGMFAHRFWQFLLWMGLTAGASMVLANRMISIERKYFRLLFAGWLFLFFLRIGVYYHLQVIVIVTILGVSKKHPWWSLLSIVIASIWAGISRVNWFVMPAMMAIAIYILETPLPKNTPLSFRQFSVYFSKPIVWSVTGVLSAFSAQTAYVFFSGNADNAKAFTSSFTSDLLWYRLLPNDSYPLGIIAGVLIVSGPLLIGIILSTVNHWRALHPARWITLYGMIVLLFAGSLVVSVKIGGGGDLHNTDTYAVLLSIVTAGFIGQKVTADFESVEDWVVHKHSLIAVAVVIPVLFLIPGLYPYPRYQNDINQTAHQQLVEAVANAEKQGPVLFTSERQMLTFGEVDTSLVSDYEVVILMEMAMSENQEYLDRFYFDLKNHRFSAIVAGKQNLGIKEEGVFYEENNAWNQFVSPYIVCYYEPTQTIDAELRSIYIFTPRITSECLLQ